jgi:60 kDa SS-A/Ro ribonucleoprotein
LVGRTYNAEALPELAREFEAYKPASDRTAMEPPDVPFQMLTALDLSPDVWKSIARRAPWQTTRMNLNTFARHRVFEDAELTGIIADRLRNRELIEKARAFPYQLMIAYAQTGANVPNAVREALQDAMEIAISNVPTVSGQVYIFPDISGSMHSPVTGKTTASNGRAVVSSPEAR